MNKYVIVILIVLQIISSCFSPYERDTSTEGLPGTETPITVSDLFTQPDDDNKIRRFYTNDTTYRTSSGYTLWTYSSDRIDFIERSIAVRKPYGNSMAGYGMIICSDQRMTGESTDIVFLTVMINNNGQYSVGKVVNASYKHLISWTDGKALLKGVGLSHKIKVVRDLINQNKYDLYLNDVLETSFVDEEAPRCEGFGRNGYIVVIAPSDLNNNAVEVWFEEL